MIGGTKVNGTAGNYQSTPANAPAQAEAWEFDPASDTWRQLTSSTRAASRESAVAFSIGDIGYVGLGRNGTVRSSEIWQYDVSRSDD